MSAATLREAARIVRERGLAKGVFRDAKQRVCLVGALRIAHAGSMDLRAFSDPDVWRRYVSDEEAVRGEVGLGIGLTAWSDDPERTAEDVAAALEAAADALDAK